MQLTPSQAFEHIKEQVIQYLETAYKISHPAVYAERGELLRARGTIGQAPFIEATPAFPTARKLRDLERAFPDLVPDGLAELVQHGVPVDRFNLYTHQEESLLQAFSDKPNLLVATGTGSGKTESFLLPILADIVREAYSWPEVAGPYERGRYDSATGSWLHSRRHETRTPAIRAIVLYPMNALVNDQLSRLRRILSREESPDWQRRNFSGNVIHFGMYTSLTKPTGPYTDQWRRDKFQKYFDALVADWEELKPELRKTGSWPRPDSPEMLCRWDIQQAPPDIVVTNYSMLEYMLIRPIESSIFEHTRKWLATTPGARLTLVLDEAHTYTGAKGTEVAHLVRRLKERLGIEPGSDKFRAIATTASVPQDADDKLRAFTSDLFGEPADRFSLIRLGTGALDVPTHSPTPKAFDAFSGFHTNFNIQDPFPAIDQLASDLDLGTSDHTEHPQVALHRLLDSNSDIAWVRQRTARKATLFDALADECWSSFGDHEAREHALAGVLSAGSFARSSASGDTPPLLSMRLHAFFRGISGIWACMNPECPEVPPQFRSSSTHPRPVGRIYFDPRPWCTPACGSRVLELFSCRKCGLLFLGGIPDSVQSSLWPWSDDLSGERQNLNEFSIFGVELPHIDYPTLHRSVRTTLQTHPEEPTARLTYEIDPTEENGNQVSPYPQRCPRCQNYRAPGEEGREIIEPLRTKGPRTFSIAVEDGLRVQPRSADGTSPNFGRKALIFTDSRPEAAQLAADIRRDHHGDLFRQLLYRALHNCPTCHGHGFIEREPDFVFGEELSTDILSEKCPDCGGTGRAASPQPLPYSELASRVQTLQFELGINPTNDIIHDFYSRLNQGDEESARIARAHFDLALRHEICEAEFSLEPLGLAAWQVPLPEQFGAISPLSEEETRVFIRSAVRILASENIVLPPAPQDPWAWSSFGEELIKLYERKTIIWANGTPKVGNAVPYNLTNYRKIGRYVIAVSKALRVAGRLPAGTSPETWVSSLRDPLWKALRAPNVNILTPAGAKINDQTPFGIRIDRFQLHPIGDVVHRCTACSYIMSETVCNVCTRCGQTTAPIPSDQVQSYYRLAALYALQDSLFDDPYPIRSIEHTAQIPGHEARDIERWFQDMFHDNQRPEDYRVDILSVTTTMEMGIDIGSLLSVGLRNVPPTVANYQQRAGRAGRRGSSIATVLTFAQPRSHDQYYFSHPPEIVSSPPRVPSLYIENDVIARRHVRALVLQAFFHTTLTERNRSDLFSAWGKISDFINQQTADKLQRYLSSNRATLIERCKPIVHPSFESHLVSWMSELVTEIQGVVSHLPENEGLLEQLINAGLLPKYAFPVDVVSLNIPSQGNYRSWEDESGESDDNSMQRELKLAIAEYAPGAEVMRGEFPRTFIYRSAGAYDAYAKQPDYSPTGTFLECADCQAVHLLTPGEPLPDQCQECDSFDITPLPYLRPPGFTVDMALANHGRKRYDGGGRERSGTTLPARLMLGSSSFTAGQPLASSTSLYTLVRRGHLFRCNKGANRQFPGFVICPTCGRSLSDDELEGSHKYPAPVPPHMGKNRGPRAGTVCPNRGPINNKVILGDPFFSEVILMGVDLPPHLDAPFLERSGQAVWYSVGTLLANAATLTLQIDPGELKVGVRPARRSATRIHGEVFLYDDVPGGAGYAHAIQQNLPEILNKALEIGEHCSNPNCTGACYHCMYDYRNQLLHPVLDRELGASVLRYVLHGHSPVLPQHRIDQAALALSEYARDSWQLQHPITAGKRYFPLVLQNTSGTKVALWVTHPLEARPSTTERQAILAEHGLRCAVHTSFDLERRPFWVLNNLVRS